MVYMDLMSEARSMMFLILECIWWS